MGSAPATPGLANASFTDREKRPLNRATGAQAWLRGAPGDRRTGEGTGRRRAGAHGRLGRRVIDSGPAGPRSARRARAASAGPRAVRGDAGTRPFPTCRRWRCVVVAAL